MEKILERARATLEYSQDHVERWQKDFAEDASHALRWGGTGVFEHAAVVQVFGIVVAAFDRIVAEHGEVTDAKRVEFLNECMRRTLYAARNPPMSTSPSANLLEQFEAKAWSRAYACLNGESFY